MKETTKTRFVLDCFENLLSDGEPHRYREIVECVRDQSVGTEYEGTIEANNVALPILAKLRDPAYPYRRTERGIYQMVDLTLEQAEASGQQEGSLYDLLDDMVELSRKAEAARMRQTEKYPGTQSLEKVYETVRQRLDELINVTTMWLADTEDLIASDPEFTESPAMGMRMG